VFIAPAAALLLLVGGSVIANHGGLAAAETMPAAMEQCGDCHDDVVGALALTPHSALESEGWELPEGATASCTACHGDASKHLEEGGGEGTIFNFQGELPSVVTDRCMACHTNTHPRFAASPHAQAGLSCTGCHSVHGGNSTAAMVASPSGSASLAGVDAKSTACYDCHAEIFTQFEFNERHRLQEGILQCTTCHNPHEPQTRAMLGAFKQEMCIDCHTDKGGPFVYEHGSVRVEGCVACHEPHGGTGRHQLLHQNQAELCYSCHVEVPTFHFGFGSGPPRFGLMAQCTNCHSAIHGSNFDPFFLN
jgi:DmsE family decaheme c-type cytochrome